jgi:hypothetical protein
MMRKYVAALALIIAAWLNGGQNSQAASITFTTAAGAKVQGNPVSAKAVITTANDGTVTIDVFNLQTNPDAVNQAISGITFTTNNPAKIDPTSLAEATGPLFSISDNGSFSAPVTTVNNLTRWHLTTPATTLIAIGGEQPDELIIGGPDKNDVYSAWNGQDQFNPYVKENAHFVIKGTNVTANTTISAFSFAFGTGPDAFIVSAHAPEPGSAALAIMGLAGLGLARWRRARLSRQKA